MDNIYKLKVQLEEAARYANSTVMGHDRLAVIVMDNFIELQLGKQMAFKFRIEYLNDYKNLKYPLDKRKEIFFNHDKLLKVCHQEGLISAHERKMLQFAHDVRNRLYHRGEENGLLIKAALYILHDIILNKQTNWGGGTDIIGVPMDADFEHPFTKKRKKELGPRAYETGSEEDWSDFLKYKFDIIEHDQSPSFLLADFLRSGVAHFNSSIKFALGDKYKKTEFDKAFQQYSFKIKCQDRLQELKEMNDKVKAKTEHDGLYKQYLQSFKPIDINRIKGIESLAQKIEKLPTGEALEKYLSVRDEFFLIVHAFDFAAQDKRRELEEIVDKHIEKMKNKKVQK